MRKALLVVLILSSALAWAQGGCTGQKPLNGMTTGGFLKGVANASVRVCSDTLTPCTTIPLYSDAALTQSISNPVTTDATGNYQYCAAPGSYNEQISGSGISGHVDNTPVTITGLSVRYVSAYSSIQAAINAANAAPPRHVVDDRMTDYTGAGFTVFENVMFDWGCVNYTLTSPVTFNGRSHQKFCGSQGSSSFSKGTTLTSANGLNDDLMRSGTTFGLITSIVRASNVATVTLASDNGNVTVGRPIRINGVADATNFPSTRSFATGTLTIASVTNLHTFTVNWTGANASSSGGHVFDDSVGHAMHWFSLTGGVRLEGNSANQSRGSCLVGYDFDENGRVDDIYANDCKTDGIEWSGQFATSGGLRNISSFNNGRYGLNSEDAAYGWDADVSGDNNGTALIHINAQASFAGRLHPKAEAVANDGTQDSAMLLETDSTSNPSLLVLAGYFQGPSGTPKTNVAKIIGGNFAVGFFGVHMEGYTNCVDDTVNAGAAYGQNEFVPQSYCDKVLPAVIDRRATSALALFDGSSSNSFIIGNHSKISARDFGGFARLLLGVDNSNLVSISGINTNASGTAKMLSIKRLRADGTANDEVGSVNNSGTVTMTDMPIMPMVWGSLQAGAGSASVEYAQWTVPVNATITAIEANLSSPAAGCATAAVVGVYDGSAFITTNFTLANGTSYFSSTGLSLAVTAGTKLRIRTQTGSSGCTTAPSNINWAVTYKPTGAQ